MRVGSLAEGLRVPPRSELGTDCQDCGARIFCVSCPEDCHLSNELVPKAIAQHEACMEHMYHNGRVRGSARPASIPSPVGLALRTG